VGPGPFRLTVAALSVAVLVAARLASVGGPGSLGAYFIAGYALTMVLNVLVPHVAATVALGIYAPGTATALVLNLPLGCWLVYRSLTEGYVEPSVFAVVGPVTAIGILASIPLLFALGRSLTHSQRRRPAAG